MSSSVEFDGTTVEKVGADVPLTFIVGVAGSWSEYENGQAKPGVLSSSQSSKDAVSGFNQNSNKNIEVDTWENVIDCLDIGVTGSQGQGHYSKAQSMPRGTRTNSDIKVKVGNKSILDDFSDFLVKNKPTYNQGSFTFQDSKTGSSKEIFGWEVTGQGVTFKIGAQVAAYTAGQQGTIDALKDEIWHDPAFGSAKYETTGFSKRVKLQICVAVLPAGTDPGQTGRTCPDVKPALEAIGFNKQSEGKYVSEDWFKCTEKTFNDLNGETFWYVPHVNGTKTSVSFCGMTMDQLCCKFEEEADDPKVDDESLIKNENYKWPVQTPLSCPDGTPDNPCEADSSNRKLIYEKLAEHLTAAGFTKILPDSFGPVLMNRQGDAANGTFQFVAYDLTGEYVKVTDIASKSSKIWNIENAKIGVVEVVPESVVVDPDTGGIKDYNTVKALAFGTTEADVQKINKDLQNPAEYKFNAEVYANVVRTTIWQMAEVWHQTARLTTNDPRDDKASVGAKIIKDKLVLNGGQTQDVSIFGTKLDLKKILFNTFHTYAAAAGIKIGFLDNLIKFKSDIIARKVEDTGVEGPPVTYTCESSITFKKLMQLITDSNKPHNENNFKEQLQVSLPTIQDGRYHVDDISFTYDFTWWNNWKFQVTSPDDITDWASYGGAITWDIDENRTLTVSKFADASGPNGGAGTYGLDLTWKIEANNRPSYEQTGLKKIMRQSSRLLDGALLKSGFMFNPQTGKGEFSTELSKEVAKGINASMSLTDATMNAKFQKSYGENNRGWGKADFGFHAGFGVAFKNATSSNLGDAEENGAGGNPFDILKYNAQCNLDAQGTLFRLGNALGTVVYDVSMRTSLSQISGVVRGIGLHGTGTWKITLRNKVLYQLLGLPANIHPSIGGAFGFVAQDVESTYFGTKYRDFKYSIGVGLFSFSIVPHSRKEVIEDIIERKKYGTLKIPLIAGPLAMLDFFGWASEEETDEDYIARMWPCLVYNVINWAREDYDEKLRTQYDAMAQGIDSATHCETLKLQVGLSLQETYNKYFGCGEFSCGLTLNEEHATFYNGGFAATVGMTVGSYKTFFGEDRWVHWIQPDPRNIGRYQAFPEKPNVIPMMWPPRPPSVLIKKEHFGKFKRGRQERHWVNQNGIVISNNLVRAVRKLGAQIGWGNPDDENGPGFPNLEPDTRFITFDTNTAGFLESSQMAYLYFVREIMEFNGAGDCNCSKPSEQEPCKTLLHRWKMLEIQRNQTREITASINNQLLQYRDLTAEQLNGLNKERSVTNSLWELFYNWITGKSNREYEFNLKDFLEDNEDLWYQDQNGNVQGWAPKKGGIPWANSTHEVTNFAGSQVSMKMLELSVAKKALQGKNLTKQDPEAALTNMHTDPVWGLVKCYFTYMAPHGKEEEWVFNDTTQQFVLNDKFYDPYDPREPDAVAKRQEIQKAGREAIQKAAVLDVIDENGNPTFVYDSTDPSQRTMKDGSPVEYYKVDPKRLKDRYGNLNVELLRPYRTGWVYRARASANGSLGDIVWVVPARTMHKHDHALAWGKTNGVVGKTLKLLKLGAQGGGMYTSSKVTDVCTRKVGSGGFLDFFRQLFTAKPQEAYRTLPWLYLDRENHLNNKQPMPMRNNVSVDVMNSGSFKHYPNASGRNTKFPPAPMSYQNVPWKGNPASCYLNFYEFMEIVQQDALDYFFPELREYIEPDAVHSFCLIKEKLLGLTGRFSKGGTILENCKACVSCNLRTPTGSDGSIDGAWGELVGLRSMIGAVHSPSDSLNVKMDDSLSYENLDPWKDSKDNDGGGGMTHIFDEGVSEATKYNVVTYAPFDSLYKKFEFVSTRLLSIRQFLTSAERAFGANNITMPFQKARTFYYPTPTNPEKTYTYEKGESITNAKELATLKDLLNSHQSALYGETGYDKNVNVLNLMNDFDQIVSEPKYADAAGNHKFYDSVISDSASSVGSIAAQECIGRNNKYCTTGAVATEINNLIKEPIFNSLYKPFPNDVIGDIIKAKWGANYSQNVGGAASIHVKALNQATPAGAMFYNSGSRLEKGGLLTEAWLDSTLSTQYIKDSQDILTNYVSVSKDLKWIWDTRNPDNQSGGITRQERNQKKWFYNYVNADLLSSYFVFSIAMTPWKHQALDLLINYWKDNINWQTLVVNLGYRLYPLLEAYSKISPMYISQQDIQALQGSGLRNQVAGVGAGSSYLAMLGQFGGYTNDPMKSKDENYGPSWSTALSEYNYGPTINNSRFDFGMEDILFRQRDNLLSLLFQGVHPQQIYSKPGKSDQEIITRIRELDPLNNLFVAQVQADNQVIAYHNPDYDVSNFTFGTATAVINSLCSSSQESQVASSNWRDINNPTFLRPFGRGRFANSSTSFFPVRGVLTGTNGLLGGPAAAGYRSEKGNILPAYDIYIPKEQILVHKFSCRDLLFAKHCNGGLLYKFNSAHSGKSKEEVIHVPMSPALEEDGKKISATPFFVPELRATQALNNSNSNINGQIRAGMGLNFTMPQFHDDDL